MVYTFYTCTKNIHVLCKMYIDYKYQLSHVITKYIRKHFEYHYIMILRFHTRRFANEQNSAHSLVATYGQTDQVHAICVLVYIFESIRFSVSINHRVLVCKS